MSQTFAQPYLTCFPQQSFTSMFTGLPFHIRRINCRRLNKTLHKWYKRRITKPKITAK